VCSSDLLYIFLAIVFSVFLLSNSNIQLKDCKCKNIELKGRVKIVTSGADFRIKVVESQPDLRVKKVERSPVECGEWQFVSSGEDFTVEFVSTFPDFTIKYVDVSPGMN
jgi:hypothetical protein